MDDDENDMVFLNVCKKKGLKKGWMLFSVMILMMMIRIKKLDDNDIFHWNFNCESFFFLICGKVIILVWW